MKNAPLDFNDNDNFEKIIHIYKAKNVTLNMTYTRKRSVVFTFELF